LAAFGFADAFLGEAFGFGDAAAAGAVSIAVMIQHKN
jgi:hypothetical protein